MSDRESMHSAFSDDYLDAGLRVAFTPTPRSRVPGPKSIIPEIDFGRTEAASPRAPVERYEILGEIARGGVGMVLRGRDVDIGRDVAMKVLLERHRARPAVVERFVEEVRISGQLQHPGVVPVYDFGVLEDKRPFFTMKLVEGSTLADLLSTRESLDSDRRRFLGIFEQICQTVAYAHSKGIVHRDLKPSNVMVGAFGEVQVMDWGLSRVLAAAAELERSEGAVMGTPGYLSPEAARGEIASLDERADVFGLGAILCEILTGKPPFVGVLSFETVLQAANRDLDDAFARLDVSGADPELIAIAKSCLAADAASRPRDASKLATRVAQHLASVEARARRLELAVAEAHAKASSERRVRKLAVGLAVVVVLGAAGTIWVQIDRAARRGETTRAASRAMESAQSFRAAARESRDPAAWARAVASAQAAAALAKPNETDLETAEAAQRLLSEVGREDAEARAQAAEEAADRATLQRIESIRARAGDTWAWKRVDSEYADAFRPYQLDPAAPDSTAAVDRMSESGIRVALASALDGWSATRVKAYGRSDPAPAKLLQIAWAIDEDPFRRQVRSAFRRRDLDELGRLVASEGLATLSATTLDRLADAFLQAGDNVTALATYRTAQSLQPDDFWLNFTLANLLARSSPPQSREALRFNQAAVALRSTSAPAWNNLGANLISLGRADEAVAALQRAVSLDGALAAAHLNLADVWRRQAKLDEATAEIHEAIRLSPEVARNRSSLGLILKDRGDLDGALSELEEARRLDPNDPEVRIDLGAVLKAHGRVADAEAEYREAVRLRPDSGDVRGALASFLDSTERIDEAIREARDAIRSWPESYEAHVTLGLALRKRDQLDEAVATLREAVRLRPDQVNAHIGLGVALWFHGNLDGAAAELKEAVRLGPLDFTAHNNLGALLLERDDDAGALAAFRTTVQLAPNNATCLANLAMVLSITQIESDRDPAQAVRLARRATEIEPGDARTWNSLGLASYRAADFDGCLAAMDKSFALSKGGRALDWCIYAMACERLGRHDSALEWLAKSLASHDEKSARDPKRDRAEAEAREVVGSR